MQVGVRIDIRLLHHVFHFRFIAHDRPHGAINPLVVTAQDQLEQRALPCQHAPDDFHVQQRIVEFWFYSGGHVMLPSLYRVLSAKKVTLSPNRASLL